MKHLKLFETMSQYESFKNGSDFVLPNVSYCQDNKSVWYNSFIEPTSSYIAVDLGLPSGRLWADRNVGASSPEDYGLYFQWGDTVGYTAEQVGVDKVFNRDWSDYFDTADGNNFNKYEPNTSGKFTILEAVDDAASVNMGSEWSMPTENDINELIDNTTATFIDLQGNEFSRSEAQDYNISNYNLKGVKFTGSNGNSIFIPTAGYCMTSMLNSVGSYCNLWSNELNLGNYRSAKSLFFTYDGRISVDNKTRFSGCTVRGVK